MAPRAASNALRHVVCCGIVRVALPPERALRYFTPEGERAWAPGWDPAYPAARAGLQRFADGYDNLLKQWERLIATALAREPRPKGN
jgi:hypothetical protein